MAQERRELVDGGLISGATTPTLTISEVGRQEVNASYDVVVSDGTGSAISETASITVVGNFDWQPGEGIPGLNGAVNATTTWSGPQGEWLVVGGSFSLAGETPVNNIAAWDGASWHASAAGWK